MRRVAFLCLSLLLIATLAPTAHAGTYLLVGQKIREADPTVPGNIGPYAIVHPPGYASFGGSLTVRVCVRPGSESLIDPVDWAISMWNRHLRKLHNCPQCQIREDPAPDPGSAVSAAGVLLHELGHCAVGLGHSNHKEILTDAGFTAEPWRTGECDDDSNGSCGDTTSFTDAGFTTEILTGADGIRGSRDDDPLNQCGFVAPMTLAFIPDPDEMSRQLCAASTAEEDALLKRLT